MKVMFEQRLFTEVIFEMMFEQSIFMKVMFEQRMFTVMSQQVMFGRRCSRRGSCEGDNQMQRCIDQSKEG